MKGYPHIRYVSEQVCGNWQNTTAVRCAGCQTDRSFPRIPQNIFEKYLRQRGYQNPGNSSAILCPTCVEIKEQEAARMKAEDEERKKRALTPKQKQAVWLKLNDPKAKPEMEKNVKVEQPRSPTREENRRVMDALDEHYDISGLCYVGSFSDESVSSKLNVPRAWVEDIREKLYGPNVNQVRKDAAPKLDALEAKLKTVIDESLATAQKAEDAIKQIQQIKTAIGKAA